MQTPFSNHPHIEMVRRDLLRPTPGHARKHDEQQLGKIEASICRFGFLVPVIADGQNRIVAGHGRWLAAGRANIEEIPVIRAEFLTDLDRRAFALAENRISELGGWDDDLLKAELNALFDGGYNLDITGFSTSDLDFSVSADEAEEEAVELPDPTDQAVSQPGDLWSIGPLQLLCGDARAAESYERLLGAESAAMIFSDPPYNVQIDGNVAGRGRHREFAMGSGEQSPAEMTAFLRAVFRNCVRFSAPASIHFHCMDWRHMREIQDAAEGVYAELKQLITWVKNNGGMGTFYRSRHELIFAFKAGPGRHINNFGLGGTGRYRTNVWEYAGANSFRKGRARDLSDHPTVKPSALVADAILDCSHRGDLILDPFSGSGTTLLAALKTGRRGAAIELDPLYVDVAVRRLIAASGLTAINAHGISFEDVAAQRSQEMKHG
ncbi:site-specific DNA-methyltransferase [Sphingobium tyrosinilyticum]|uniref:Methyltransferase n=1 Tax=Sphingobium tyrosinilyticum TaxID=2715436 RepID=A0ABV9F106_9SPHN